MSVGHESRQPREAHDARWLSSSTTARGYSPLAGCIRLCPMLLHVRPSACSNELPLPDPTLWSVSYRLELAPRRLGASAPVVAGALVFDDGPWTMDQTPMIFLP